MALNFSGADQYRQPGDSFSVSAGERRGLFLPSNYGRVWSTEQLAAVAPRARAGARSVSAGTPVLQLA